MTIVRLAAVAGLLAAAAPATAAAPLRFEAAFDPRGEPAALHLVAQYGTGAGQHRLELWRDSDHRIRRTTDAAVDTFGVKPPRDENFTLHVLDLHRRINTRIDRATMYRMGNFTDWFDLTHGLRHPRGKYLLTPSSAPAGSPRPLAPCRWFDLAQGARHSRICWSTADRIPLLISGDGGRIAWRVVTVDRKPIADTVFRINDRGFVRVDAVADMERD